MRIAIGAVVLSLCVAPGGAQTPSGDRTYAITHVETDRKLKIGVGFAASIYPYSPVAQEAENFLVQKLNAKGLSHVDRLNGPCCKITLELLEMAQSQTLMKAGFDLSATVTVIDAGGQKLYFKGYRGEGRASASRVSKLLSKAAENLAENISNDPDLMRLLTESAVAAATPQQPAATVDVKIGSVPSGGDIEINRAFSGNTPSTFKLVPGEYRIAVTMQGYNKWERSLKVDAASAISLNAELVPVTAPAPAAPAPDQTAPAVAGTGLQVIRAAQPDSVVMKIGMGVERDQRPGPDSRWLSVTLTTKGYSQQTRSDTVFKIRDETNAVYEVYAVAVETDKFTQGVMYFRGDATGVELLFMVPKTAQHFTLEAPGSEPIAIPLKPSDIAAPSSKAAENPRDGRFIAYDNGTVLDSRTKLIWASKDNGADINWANAKSYCTNYRGGGFEDWRMPTIDELDGLYDGAKQRPAACKGEVIHVATELIDITCLGLWSSETASSDIALFIRFNGDGGEKRWEHPVQAEYFRALPVRSGK
jgi:hypothetical protein